MQAEKEEIFKLEQKVKHRQAKLGGQPSSGAPSRSHPRVAASTPVKKNKMITKKRKREGN